MKKRTIANLIMSIIILLIMTAGILGVGHLRGWFDRSDESQALLTQVQGTVNMQRDGVIYPVENEMILRAGDKLLCNPGATAVIQVGDSCLTIGQSAELEISDPTIESFCADVAAGEVFANTVNPVTLTFDEKTVTLTGAAAHLSVRSGAQDLSIFSGTVEGAAAGKQLSWVGDELSVGELSIESLNDFTISQIRIANQTLTLYFTNADLDQLAADRQAAIQELLSSADKSTEETAEPSGEDLAEETASDEDKISESTAQAGADAPAETAGQNNTTAASTSAATTASASVGTATAPASSETSTGEAPSAGDTTEASAAEAPSTEVPTTAAPTTEAPATETPTTAAPSTAAPTTEVPTTEAPTTAAPTEAPATAAPTEAPATAAPTEAPATAAPVENTCTITIRCDTILNNMSDLDPGKVEFVPGDGVILAPVTVEFDEGETVFDVLQRVCSAAGIQLEYSWTPMYDSYYIEGINQLYEFDCGSESGWMYKVNGWFPNYGCSSYTLANGDVIEWHYTCKGLGTDVGAPAW